ncbi:MULTISPECIES: efflux RND transporter periplasmic adaptor subunit [Sulfurimonas]|uniref:efflux RND transporter periplasmic adaptor subunit n=1 Tax=Sulfurimonas TaxID=202746 RepID=UPI00126593B1|nr:efflux RND transporter periplasmic adaptor subunit [Sulfurimonas indica]
MKKIIALVIVAVVVVGAGIFLKKQKDAVAHLQTPKMYTHNVDVVHAQNKRVEESRVFLAEIVATNSAYIASKFSANIKKIYVNENDVVKKGALLIALDDSEIKATLASLRQQKVALEADLDNAKNILERNKKLFAIAAISQEAYDTSNVVYKNKLSALKSVDEKIKQTKSQLKYLNIRAPFNGRVGSKLANDGSLALPGKALLTLNSDDQKLLFSFVDTTKPILEGQKVYLNNKLIGKVTKRYDDAKNALLVAEVKPFKALPYANKSFKTISVVVDSAEGCTLPLNALLHKTDGVYAMLYKDKKFTAKKVDVLLQNDREAIISECIEEPVATASEAKLSLLPSYGQVVVNEDR